MEDRYNKEILIRHYNKYNSDVIDYFKNTDNMLLVINLKEKDVGEKIADFLNINKALNNIPWKNKT